MIEKIIYKKKLFAQIVRGKYRSKKGITFFTQPQSTRQFGYMKHKKNFENSLEENIVLTKSITKILVSTEVILILKGLLRVDFYTSKKKYLFSKILKKNDIIMLVHGGHGFKVLKNVEMLEVKQGPYSLSKDKIKFENINENKIKIKK